MDVNDFPVDYIEESHSDVLSETNIDLLLADVSEVQKILNSNNIGQHVDVNEIYEKLEELTYIVREERIGYVATQLLYKFGIITDKDGDVNFKFNIHHGGNDVENLSLPHGGLSVPDISEACISSDEDGIIAEVLQNSILVQSGRPEQRSDVCEVFNNPKTDPNYDVHGYYSKDTDINHNFHVEEATNDKIFVDYHSTNCAQENMTELKPSVCNEGLGNFVLVAEARDSDNPVFSQDWRIMQEAEARNSDNSVYSQDQKIMPEARNSDNPVLSEDQEIMQEAEFISGMFPHFELEQIVEFININRDIENRIETVSEEILKLQESMLQENHEMSESVKVKDKVNSKDLHEHSNELDNNNIGYVAKEVTHIKSENEQLLQNRDSVNYLPNSDSITGQTSAPECLQFPQQRNSVFQSNQGYSTVDKQKPIYSADESSSHFEPVVFVPETNASTSLPVGFVLPKCLQLPEQKNSVSQSNLEPVNILDQNIPVPHKLSDFVPSVPSIVNEIKQRTVTELMPAVSQLNNAVTPDIIDSSASENARAQPETLQPVSQPNSLVLENLQSSSDMRDLSYSGVGSQAEVVSTITKSNDAEDKVTESTYDEVIVLCEIHNSVSEQASSHVDKVTESTYDEVNVLWEKYDSISEQASSHVDKLTESTYDEVNVLCEIYDSVSEEASSHVDKVTESTYDEVDVSCEIYDSVSEQGGSQSEASTSAQLTSSDFKSAVSVHHDDVSSVFETAEISAHSLNNPPTEVIQPTQTSLNQGCRKKEITYEEFVAALPNVDIVLLKDVWAQIGTNYSAIKEFISQQLEDESDNNPYHLLLSMFPQADPKFLQENSLIIGSDEAALKHFIDEQLKLDDSKAQYHMLLSMFPKVDSTFLHDKCIQIGKDEEAMRKLIVELLNSSEPEDNNYHTLLAMFPDSDPAFLRQQAERIANDNDAMKKFVAEHLEEVEAVQFRTLLAVLPDADPEYLHKTYQELGNNEESIKLFITEALENKDYPTRESYLKRKEIATLKRKYKEELNLEEYLDVIPDPWNYFRKGKTTTKDERQHVLSYLELRYKRIDMAEIKYTLQNNNHNLTLTCEKLDKWKGPFYENRVIFQHQVPETEDIPISFLQEVAFIEKNREMKEYLERKEQQKKEAFELAKATGQLLECQCCFDEELMDMDVSTCADGHVFCKSCVRRSAEVTIGRGGNQFSCLTDCNAEFSLRVLQSVLHPTTFSRMIQRKQLEEVQAAGIEDLESCPFCDFATIPPVNSKVFTCLNPDCMRDSCRKCKRPSHIPLRCGEVECKEIKVRTLIEDRMTEALVRTCWKCKKKFIKESGCNKMSCECGAMMCYLCRQPVKDYTHFNGQGGTEFHKCALFSDLEIIHDVAVQEEGIKAKKEVQEQNPDVELKHDPTELKLK